MERSYGVIPVKLTGVQPEFLIVQHADGHWGFPKGHPKTGETATTTAQRELLEATGLRDGRLDDQAMFTEQYHFMRDGAAVVKDVKYFLVMCQGTSTPRAADEIKRVRWVTLAEGMDVITFQTSKDILKEASAHLQTHDLNQWT